MDKHFWNWWCRVFVQCLTNRRKMFVTTNVWKVFETDIWDIFVKCLSNNIWSTMFAKCCSAQTFHKYIPNVCHNVCQTLVATNIFPYSLDNYLDFIQTFENHLDWHKYLTIIWFEINAWQTLIKMGQEYFTNIYQFCQVFCEHILCIYFTSSHFIT